MEVRPISNNQPVFHGYVDKNLTKFVNKIVKKECYWILETAISVKKDLNSDMAKKLFRMEQTDANLAKNINLLIQNKDLDFSSARSVYQLGQRVLSKLQEFVKPMHKDIGIKLERGNLKLLNPTKCSGINIIPSSFTDKNAVVWSDKDKNSIFIDGDFIYNNKPGVSDLETIENIIDILIQKIKPNEVDEAFLEIAEKDIKSSVKENRIGLFGWLKTNFAIKRIEKYAKSIGKTTEARQIAEHSMQELKNAKQAEAQRLQAEKEWHKRHKQKIKDILSGK